MITRISRPLTNCIRAGVPAVARGFALYTRTAAPRSIARVAPAFSRGAVAAPRYIEHRRAMSYGSNAEQRLAGKTVLLTGASAGIGQAVALELAAAAQGNLKLVLAARRVDRLTELKSVLESKYPNCQVLPLKLDVSDYKTIRAFVDSIPKEFSEIDVLINNAGMVYGTEKVGDILDSDLLTMFDTNVMGLITLTQAVLPGMKARGRGDVLNMGSIAGRDPYPGGSVYCATKAAVSSFTHALRKELIDTRIRVMEVQPGAVETEFSLVRFKGDEKKAAGVYEGTEPMTAQDVAEVITFILTRRENTVVAETLLFPSHQASGTHIHRKK